MKARVVRHQGSRFRSAPLPKHIKYLKREGVTRDGEEARMFDASSEVAGEHALAAMVHERRLAVHQLRSRTHHGAEHLADRLVSETHAEHGAEPGETLDQPRHDARVLRASGTGRCT